jgi:hypothetical protein
LAWDTVVPCQDLTPFPVEFVFWLVVTLATKGRTEEALPLFARAFRMNPAWMLLVPRLADVGQLPNIEGLQ